MSLMGRFFNADLPFFRFCWNVLLFSLLSMLPFLITYVAITPGFTVMLATNSTAFSRFMRQVMTNGLPVVFLINYAGFVAASARLQRKKRSPYYYVILDGLGRAVLFVGLHAFVYVISVDLFGSFGGDRGTALQVVGPTLQRAWLFENISGAYLYSAIPGALVAHGALLRHFVTGNSEADALRTRALGKSVVLVSALGVVVFVTLLSSAMTAVLGRP
jgi:hypothetical protein